MRKYQRNWFEIAENHNWIKELKILEKIPPICTPVISVNSPGRSRVPRSLPEPQTGEIRGLWSAWSAGRSSMTPSQLESLWQDAGDRSQPDPQSWQVSGTQSQPSRNPGRSRDTKSAEPQILALTVRASPKLVRQSQVHWLNYNQTGCP